MSIKLMSAIFETEFRDLEYTKDGEERKAKASTCKLLLLAIADHANDYGESAYPGYDKLEIKTALSRQGIADTICALVNNGILTIKDEPSKLGTNDYVINIESFPKMTESSHLTSTSQATRLARVKPLDLNHQLTITKPIGSYEPQNIEQAIFAGKPVTEKMLDGYEQKHAQMIDSANLLDMGCIGGGVLALAFMEARSIIIPESKIKGQRKVARELIKQGVTPDHVREAVKKLLEENMTVTDLFSVEKTAVSLANPPQEQGYNPQGLEIKI